MEDTNQVPVSLQDRLAAIVAGMVGATQLQADNRGVVYTSQAKCLEAMKAEDPFSN